MICIRKSCSYKKAKWEPLTKDDTKRGIYNFKEEVPQIRTFLDKLHARHEQDEIYFNDGYYNTIVY
jgi:hypothetical protein